MTDIKLDEPVEMGEAEKEALAARVAVKIEVLQSEIKEREEAVANYKSKMEELLGEGELHIGTPETGFFKFSSYVSKPFNAALAEEKLPHERWLAASKPGRVTTAAFAKKVLTEEEYALCQKPNSKATTKIERLVDDE